MTDFFIAGAIAAVTVWCIVTYQWWLLGLFGLAAVMWLLLRAGAADDEG